MKSKKFTHEETEIKIPVKTNCAYCNKRIIRDYYDIVRYQIKDLEFCSEECFKKYIKKIEEELQCR